MARLKNSIIGSFYQIRKDFDILGMMKKMKLKIRSRSLIKAAIVLASLSLLISGLMPLLYLFR